MADVNVDINLKYRAEICFRILEEYSWLLDSYILDFFTENHVEKLPKSWLEQVQRILPEELGYLIDLKIQKQHHVWPLSLLCLRNVLKNVSLPRYPEEPKVLDKNKKEVENNIIHNLGINNKVRDNCPCFKHPRLKNLFLKHVKPKKRYEIYRMAEMTAELAEELNVKYVVDVGSGLGHLSRIMAYGFGLNVCCLETQLALSKQAEKLDLELEVTASKHLSDIEMDGLKTKRPVHTHETLTFESGVEEFVKILKKAFNTNDNNFKFGIVGLHPCGNLTAILLKIFMNCQEAQFINLVGCCYHKLTTSKSCDSIGFPLSNFCKLKYVDISYEARALACHAIETYCSRLRSKNYDHLKVHCYRAALEKIIHKNWPQHRKCALNSVKHGPDLTFSQYCESALKKLKLTVSKEDLESNETLHNLSMWQQVVMYYSFRLMLAPLIETVILIDRMLFLKENCLQCKLRAAFDPTISPRNHILTAKKSL